MKQCSYCKQLKPESAFNWKHKHLKRASHCKICSRKQIRSHYKKNTSYYLKKAKKRNAKIKKQHEEFLAKYLKARACIDCGEKDLVVLELDHRDPQQKKASISALMSDGASWEGIEEEIKKCDVRCANCHRRKTAYENNSWRLMHS